MIETFKSSAVRGVAAVLELTASEHPEMLDFQIHVLQTSAMRFALEEVAAQLGVAPRELGPTVRKAGRDSDRLERRGRRWRDPAAVLDAPNLAALNGACEARLARVPAVDRRRRLEAVLRRLASALELARSRAWIEAFIGPPLTDRQPSGRARR